jgi:hypothetical protein
MNSAYIVRWRERVAFCHKYPQCLSEWELGFIDSVDEALNAGKELSFKQSSKLAEITLKAGERVG